MRLMTCTGCAFAADCDKARDMRASLKGLHIRSVKFGCAKREDMLRPGQAAIFQTYISDDDDDYCSCVTEVRFAGYIIRQMGGKVLGYIRPGIEDIDGEFTFEARGNGYVKMPLARVTADPSRPDITLTGCKFCGSFYALDGRCDRDANFTPGNQCFAAQQGIGRAA